MPQTIIISLLLFLSQYTAMVPVFKPKSQHNRRVIVRETCAVTVTTATNTVPPDGGWKTAAVQEREKRGTQGQLNLILGGHKTSLL